MLLGTTDLPLRMDTPALLPGMCEPESGPLASVLNAFLKEPHSDFMCKAAGKSRADQSSHPPSMEVHGFLSMA